MRWNLVRDATLAVMGAAIAVIELLSGYLNPVLLMLGAAMLGLPYFLRAESEPVSAPTSAAEFEEWRRDYVKLRPAEVKALPVIPVATEPCGYCSALHRPCACKRTPLPKWQPPHPMCANGNHVASMASSTCLYCGTNLFDHSMLFA